jgi:pheromone shutdown protein TraB
MNKISTKVDSNNKEPRNNEKKIEANQPSKGDVMFNGIVTGVGTTIAASTIIQTGKGVMATLSKHPLVMLGLGITAGYLTHKYRKEIISITGKTAEQSKDFILRQKEALKDLLAEDQTNPEDDDVLK